MKSLIVSLAFCAGFAFTANAQALPQDHPMSGWTDEGLVSFWAESAWHFESEPKGELTLTIEDLEPLNGSPRLTSETFSLADFDPRNYAIELPANKPLVIQVGEAGVLFFQSAERTELLYQRAQINRAASEGRTN